MLKKDPIATKLANFADKRSYIHASGRWVLYGLDWQRQVKQLAKRCKGQCEYLIPVDFENLCWERCLRQAHDPHHIIQRSKGRDDRLDNLQALCRHHHNMMDRRKPLWRKSK